ncbi:uncharacterized protein H6S33_007100 [Morchella sextelata]|uniref:uncharacterized protein n=1 Tax=Morchella sextelata TaxID=1174677 RepID=UPI001D03D8B7|nr:uncharacterized protein H6S33_007100 [Morchella sextelata]KAH0604069.1 hypothetical protein H6S33_007100 [Morchella sextelata]
MPARTSERPLLPSAQLTPAASQDNRQPFAPQARKRNADITAFAEVAKRHRATPHCQGTARRPASRLNTSATYPAPPSTTENRTGVGAGGTIDQLSNQSSSSAPLRPPAASLFVVRGQAPLSGHRPHSALQEHSAPLARASTAHPGTVEPQQY